MSEATPAPEGTPGGADANGQSEPGLVAQLAADAFDIAQVQYLIGGSVASTIYGEPRATLDVDFAVHMDPAQAVPLAAAFDHEFYVDVDAVREAATAKRMFNAVHKKLFIKVDVHVRRAEGHSLSEMRRALALPIGPTGEHGRARMLRVATPEDTLLRKLWWFRMGDGASDRQWRDAASIFELASGDLDAAYLTEWASELGVSDLLERLFSGA